MNNSKIVLSKETFCRLIECNLMNIEVLELYFTVTEFSSQYDDRVMVAIQPKLDWKELISFE